MVVKENFSGEIMRKPFGDMVKELFIMSKQRMESPVARKVETVQKSIVKGRVKK